MLDSVPKPKPKAKFGRPLTHGACHAAVQRADELICSRVAVDVTVAVWFSRLSLSVTLLMAVAAALLRNNWNSL